MTAWDRVSLTVGGVAREAMAPLILSASRATDIPAFHSEWLLRRIEEGFIEWENPFNGKTAYVSLARARLFVFWTKNPRPLMAHLDLFDRKRLNYYFQFTLNDYEAEGFEPGLPPVGERIRTFLELSERIGPERVIWRFDPLILTDAVDVGCLLKKIASVGERLRRHTRRLVISFADIRGYANVAANLRRCGVSAREFMEPEMRVLAQGLEELNRGWGLTIATCAERVDLSEYGIGHNRCIDDRLIAQAFSHDAELMAFVNGKGKLKDKGQRKACGCIRSKDIGAYGTCPAACVYCYATAGAGKRALV